MLIITGIVISFFLAYTILIFYYHRSWNAIPVFDPGKSMPATTVSVIIPARNEAGNIGKLLNALQGQTYPAALFEVIVVDDHSEDGTADQVSRFNNVKLIRTERKNINAGKKKAIETGIGQAKNELIVTTDADCIPGPDWLRTIAAFKEKTGAVFIAAPVKFENNNSFSEIFQTLDFLVLQGITGASVYKKFHSMCNGANLAYEKKIFFEVNGFANIDHIASGDDMLLMHKIAEKYPGSIYFLKAVPAIVTTNPEKTWRGFFNQRIRWASKATVYKDYRITAVLLLVYLFNLSFLLLAVAGFWNYRYWLLLVAQLILKPVTEYPFVRTVAVFFVKQRLLNYFFIFQPFHILYTLMAGWMGQFGKYEWKGRKVK